MSKVAPLNQLSTANGVSDFERGLSAVEASDSSLRSPRNLWAQASPRTERMTRDEVRLARVEQVAGIAREEFIRIERDRATRDLNQQDKGYVLQERVSSRVQRDVPGKWLPRVVPGSVLDLYDAELKISFEIKLTKFAATGSRQRHQWRAQIQAAVNESGAVAKVIGDKTPFYFASFDDRGNARYIRDATVFRGVRGPRGYATRGSMLLLGMLSTVGIFASEILDAADPLISGFEIYFSGIKPLQVQQALRIASWQQVVSRLRLVEETNLMVHEVTGELFVVVLEFEDDYVPGDILYLRTLDPFGRLSFRDPETGDLYSAIGLNGRWGVVRHSILNKQHPSSAVDLLFGQD